MPRIPVLSLLLLGVVSAAPDTGKFEGVWKGQLNGHVYAVLTILSDHPPRGTLARGAVNTNSAGEVVEVTRDAALDLYIQAPKVVKGVLHFKTIDPNDGVVNYEMKVTSSSEATLVVGGTVYPLKRN